MKNYFPEAPYKQEIIEALADAIYQAEVSNYYNDEYLIDENKIDDWKFLIEKWTGDNIYHKSDDRV